ncbi:MAG: hypothetical protein LC731_03915, partial [Acidobacteria bacterium]|nr:hypothetical protein [Acidobacteriota bacterium]
MKYKILLVSFLVITGFAAVPRSLERFSQGMALTNQWAMAAFFWSSLLDSNSVEDKGSACNAPKSAAVASTVSSPDTEEEFRWQGRVQAGQTFEIKGVNG